MELVTQATGQEATRRLATRRGSILQRTAIACDSNRQFLVLTRLETSVTSRKQTAALDSNRHNRAASASRSPIFPFRISSSGAARIPNFYSEHIKSRNLLKYMTPQDITLFYYEHLNTSAQFCSPRNPLFSPNERPKIRVSNFASGCYSESPEIAPASNQLSQNTALQGRIRSAPHRRNMHGHIRGTQSV
jgi:hypothetical protein